MKNETKTKVIFRKIKDRDGEEVIALFPEIPADSNPLNCLSYVQQGQHGAAMASGHGWRLANSEEYREIKIELEKIGYKLEVKKRSCPSYFQKRAKELKKLA